MKRLIKYIPFLTILVGNILCGVFSFNISKDTNVNGFLVVVVLFLCFELGCMIYYTFFAKIKYNPLEFSIINLMLKLSRITAYILYIRNIASILTILEDDSLYIIFTIVEILFVALLICPFTFLTGIISWKCTTIMRDRNALSSSSSIVLSVLSFLFVLDIVAAVIIFVKALMNSKNNTADCVCDIRPEETKYTFQAEKKARGFTYVKAVLLALTQHIFGVLVTIWSAVWIILIMKSNGVNNEELLYAENNLSIAMYLVVCAVILLIVLIIPIQHIIVSAKGKYTAKETAICNFIVKLSYIPIYLICGIVIFFGFIASVWGRPLMVLSIIIGVGTFVISSVSSIACSYRIIKDNVINFPLALSLGVLSLITGPDIIAAIVFFIRGLRYKIKVPYVTTNEVNQTKI